MVVKATSLKIPLVIEVLEKIVLERPDWLHWDETTKAIKVAHLPDADQVPFPVDV
jgi:small subunit ribosomal protein S4